MSEINLQNLKNFFRSLQENGTGVKEMKKKLNSVDNFVDWANRKGLFNANEYKQLHEGIAEIRRKISSIFYHIALKTWGNRLKRWTTKRHPEFNSGSGLRQIPNQVWNDRGGAGNDSVKGKNVKVRPWYRYPAELALNRIYSGSGFDIRHYIGISIILVIIAAMGAGAYNQFFKEAQTPFAFPTNLTSGGRTLSFQGRLTDSLGNPISTATNLKFKLYNASTAGTTLYDTSTCSITPDSDGIFDVLLGGSGYSPTPPQEVCGTQITQNIFSDWPNVYLGVTVGADAEATPRQQIANVGYAINAETLQGFPPGSGFSNIPYINPQGNILIATSAAGIRNTWASTNFTLSSTGTITVQSAGSGDVALTATESGNITATTGLGTTLFNVLTGNLKVGNGAPGVSLNGEDAYIEGTLEVDAATTLDGSLTANGTVTLGDSGDTVAIDSSDWDIDTSGNASNLGTITADGKLTVNVAGLAVGIQNTTDAAANQIATFGSGNRAVPADNDEGYFTFFNDDDTGTQVEFSRMSWVATDVTNTTKDSEIQFDVQSNNTLTKILSVQGSGIDIVGEVDFSGLLVAGSSSITLTDATGYVLHDALVDCADTQILKWATGGGRWGCAADAGGNTAWDAIDNPSGNGSIAFAETVQTLDWNTAATAAAFNGLTITLTNDASTDINTQYALVVDNLDDAGATGVTEALLVLDNSDTNEAVTDGLLFVSGGGGFTDFIDTPSSVFKVDGSGNIIGVTLDTGQGANELYDMDQNVLTTSAVTFADLTISLVDGSTANIDGDGTPTTDILQIGSGDTSATDGVDALQLTFGTGGAAGASGNIIDITPSFAGGTTDLLTFNIVDIDAFSPTNAAGTDTVNGLNFGNLTDPGATITSTAIKVGTGWDTILSGTTAGTNIFNFTNASLTSGGALVTTTLDTGQGANELYDMDQNVLTTSTPQFARLGIGAAADATNILTSTSASTTDLSKTLNITHTGIITGTGYAGYFSKTGASTTNVGLYATATGATNNYAAIFDGGNVGIGTSAPTTFKLQVAGNVGPDSAPTPITLTTVDNVTSADTGQYASIYCVTATDCKISYYDAINTNLMMADCDDATCSTKTLTTVDSVTSADKGQYSSIYCLSSTDCKIAYSDVTNTNLMMADCDDATCSTKTLTTVDSASYVAFYNISIYCLATDDCKIAYYDAIGTKLMMADCDDATCSTKTLTTVDNVTSADTGQYASIYCVTATDCKISYYDNTNDNLMMADCDNATCSSKTLTTVDSVTSANTGQYTSIYCVSATDCKIAYYDVTNTNLMMADCDNATCSTKTLTTVDSTTYGSTGVYTSIYCISSIDCKISYSNSRKDLMMADCDDATCSTKTLTTVDFVDYGGSGSQPYTSIYCISSTDCKIGYFIYFSASKGSSRDLYMADCDNSTCSRSEGGYNIGSSSLFFNKVYASNYYGVASYISSFDIAENYKVLDESIEAGDIVVTDTGGDLVVAKSNTQYQSNMLGIVSTKPGITLAEWEDADRSDMRPVALAGRVPVKIASNSASIKIGDFLTSSNEPGKAMKATTAGYTIGKALERWSPKSEARNPKFETNSNDQNSNDSNVSNSDKIEVFVNLGYYDPDIYLTSTGELKIVKLETRNSKFETDSTSSPQANSLGNETWNVERITYNVKNSVGEIINRIGAYAEIISGKVKTGLIEAENAIVKNTVVVKNVVAEKITSTIGDFTTLTVSNKIISPIVETEILEVTQEARIKNLEVNEIAPKDKDIVVDLSGEQKDSIASLQNDGDGSSGHPGATEGSDRISSGDKGELAKFIIKGLDGKKAAEIDAAGNATFSGTLTSASIDTKDASISGKLIAKEIESDSLNSLTRELVNSKTDINDIQAFLAKIKNQPVSDTKYYQDLENITLSPEQLANMQNLIGNTTLNDLTVTGETSLYNVFIYDSLTAGSLVIEDNKIMSLDFELKLSALSSINLLDGQVIISKTGGLTTKGTLTAQAGIKTNEIKPINSGENVFVQNLETNKLQFSNKYLSATTSANVITAADNFQENGLYSPAIKTQAESAGIGLIRKQDEEITIYNNSITKDSLVYLTPTSNSSGNAIAVVDKETCNKDSIAPLQNDGGGVGCKPYFKVAANGIKTSDIKFNWLIIN